MGASAGWYLELQARTTEHLGTLNNRDDFFFFFLVLSQGRARSVINSALDKCVSMEHTTQTGYFLFVTISPEPKTQCLWVVCLSPTHLSRLPPPPFTSVGDLSSTLLGREPAPAAGVQLASWIMV